MNIRIDRKGQTQCHESLQNHHETSAASAASLTAAPFGEPISDEPGKKQNEDGSMKEKLVIETSFIALHYH